MKKIILLSFISLLFATCKKEETTSDCSTTKSFANDVKPLYVKYCSTGSNCHGTGSRQGPGELITYDQIVASKAKSRSEISAGSMPRGASLSSSEKNNILCWIDNGALNN
jgi:hypothetical protein